MTPVYWPAPEIHDRDNEDYVLLLDECVVDAVGEALNYETADIVFDNRPDSRSTYDLFVITLDARLERASKLWRDRGAVDASF